MQLDAALAPAQRSLGAATELLRGCSPPHTAGSALTLVSTGASTSQRNFSWVGGRWEDATKLALLPIGDLQGCSARVAPQG